jgi:hypothetical protein
MKLHYICNFKIRGVAQLASVLAWGASGRPFESDHPDKKVFSFKIEGFFYSLLSGLKLSAALLMQ